MKFMPFSDFYLIFLNDFLKYFLLKNHKKGYLPAGDDVVSRARWRADVARGTTARVRRGAKATW